MSTQYDIFPTAIRGYIKYDVPIDNSAKDGTLLEDTPSNRYYIGKSQVDVSLEKQLVKTLGPRPFYTLVIDTETFTDVERGQKFRILYYELHGISDAEAIEKYHRRQLTASDGIRLVEAGFVLPNDTSGITTREMNALQLYIHQQKDKIKSNILILSHSEFIDTVFYPYIYYGHTPGSNGRLKSPARLLGHNLYFDLGALALSWTSATRDMSGGFCLKFCTCVNENQTCLRHLPIRFKKLGATKALYKFKKGFYKNAKGITNHRYYNGVFQDTMTLGAALTAGTKGNSLQALCETFGLPGKEAIDNYNGPINQQFLNYLVTDVQRTFQLFRKQVDVLKMFNIAERLETLYSNASIDKRIRQQIGLGKGYAQRWSISDDTIGKTMSTYYGGRSEIGIRLTPTQVVCADFTSQYPATNYLMNLQELMFANDVIEQDATKEVRALLNNRNLLNLLQDKNTWKLLRCIVEIDGVPEDAPAILPIRAQFGKDDYNIATPYVTFHGKLYWTLADVIGSVLLTGNIPNVSKAIKFIPIGKNNQLKPIRLMERDDLTIDVRKPNTDLYIQLISLRHQIRNEAKATNDASQKIFLNALQQGLKLIVNAGVYGVNEEFVVREHKTIKTPVTIYATGKTQRVGNKYDEPGPYNASVIGSLIPAGGRLLLAIAERLMHDKGLHFVYCDTDSMAIGKPDTMHDKTFYKLATEVVEWFNKLSPYDKTVVPDFFKIEDVNYPLLGELTPHSKQSIDEHRKFGVPLYALAISAKRYVLYNKLPNGKFILRKVSSHGLGPYDYRKYYRDKSGHTINWPKDVTWTEHGCADWVYILYYYFVEAMESGYHHNGKPVIDGQYNPNFSHDKLMKIPAYTQDSISHSGDLKTYAGLSHLRPGTFFTVLPPLIVNSLVEDKSDYILVTDKVNAPDEIYENIQRGKVRYAKTGEIIPRSSSEFVKTLGMQLRDYFIHREFKAANGEEWTLRGILQRRHVKIPDIIHVFGKEMTSISLTLERINDIAMLPNSTTIGNAEYCEMSITGTSHVRRHKVKARSDTNRQKISIMLSSMMSNYSMPDLLAATCLPRRTLYDLKHSIVDGKAYPKSSTIERLTHGIQLLDAERENGTLFEWRLQIQRSGITVGTLAKKLGITAEQVNALWTGQQTWTIEQRSKLAELLDIELQQMEK